MLFCNTQFQKPIMSRAAYILVDEVENFLKKCAKYCNIIQENVTI